MSDVPSTGFPTLAEFLELAAQGRDLDDEMRLVIALAHELARRVDAINQQHVDKLVALQREQEERHRQEVASMLADHDREMDEADAHFHRVLDEIGATWKAIELRRRRQMPKSNGRRLIRWFEDHEADALTRPLLHFVQRVRVHAAKIAIDGVRQIVVDIDDAAVGKDRKTAGKVIFVLDDGTTEPWRVSAIDEMLRDVKKWLRSVQQFQT